MSNLQTNYGLETKKSKIEPPHRRQVVHPWPQPIQGESVAEPETLLLIILDLVHVYAVIFETVDCFLLRFLDIA